MTPTARASTRVALWLLLCASASSAPTSSQKHRNDGDAYYTAAAAQYPSGKGSLSAPAAANLQVAMRDFANLTAAAAAAGADIVVFPEGVAYWAAEGKGRAGLYAYGEEVPPNPGPTGTPVLPCTDPALADRVVLRNLSCMARAHSMVLVANIVDVQPCSSSPLAPTEQQQAADSKPCPPDGHFLFNTDVAFDEQGRLVAKYHKSHLAGDADVFDQPAVPDVVYFDTAFGVRFGLMICFDLEFAQPFQALRALNVSNFPYSTFWVNTPPTYDATMVQQAKSRTHGINIIAANNGASDLYSGGGIYSAGEIVAVDFTPGARMVEKLLVGKLPKAPAAPPTAVYSRTPLPTPMPPASVPCNLPYMANSTCAVFSPADMVGRGPQVLEAAHGNLTCSARVAVADGGAGNMSYALAAVNAVLQLPGSDPLPWQACFVLACEAPPNCAAVWAGDARFSLLDLAGTFAPGGELLPMLAVDAAAILPPAALAVSPPGAPIRGVQTVPSIANHTLWSIGVLVFPESLYMQIN